MNSTNLPSPSSPRSISVILSTRAVTVAEHGRLALDAAHSPSPKDTQAVDHGGVEVGARQGAKALRHPHDEEGHKAANVEGTGLPHPRI